MHVLGQVSLLGSCSARANAARTGDYSGEGSALPGDAKLLIVGKSDLQNRLKLLLFNEFFNVKQSVYPELGDRDEANPGASGYTSC